MMQLKITRRSVLAGLSGAAAAAMSPFIPITEHRANAAGLPKRLFLVYYSGGAVISQDWPVGGETDFTFPSLVDCFTPYKNQMIVLKNLRRGMDGSHGSHQGGTGGSPPDEAQEQREHEVELHGDEQEVEVVLGTAVDEVEKEAGRCHPVAFRSDDPIQLVQQRPRYVRDGEEQHAPAEERASSLWPA